MRWLSRNDDRDEQPEAAEPAAASDAPGPPDDLWGEDEQGAAGTGSVPGAADRPEVPVDLGVIDPTELGRATRRAVARALAEDLGDRGDITSLATVPAGRRGTGVIVARDSGVLYGVEVVLHVFEQVDTRVEIVVHVEDGAHVEAGQTVATISGPLSSILTGERVALNFLGLLSGVATRTRRFVDAAGPGVAIRDTRKTTPGLRLLEKAAVVAGGGHNHRIGLYDALLVKDNHIIAAGGVDAALEAAFSRGHGRHVQVEVRDLAELEAALRAGATDVLLDNFTPDQIRQAVTRAGGRAALEASGGVDVDTVRAYADAGVDRIAVGRITHSTHWLDVALDLLETEEAPRARTGDPLWTSDEEQSPLAAATGLTADGPGVDDLDPDDAADQDRIAPAAAPEADQSGEAAGDGAPDADADVASEDPAAAEDAPTAEDDTVSESDESAPDEATAAPGRDHDGAPDDEEPEPTPDVPDGDEPEPTADEVEDDAEPPSGDGEPDEGTDASGNAPGDDQATPDAGPWADTGEGDEDDRERGDALPFDGESLFGWRDQAIRRDADTDGEA